VKAFLVAGVATALFACFAGVARADVASIPTGTDPWTGGAAVTSPLESVAASIASTIAGRPVTVRCEDDADWETLTGSAGFDSSSILGYVSFADGRPLDFAELSPDTCRWLQSFAAAGTKPTKCAATTNVPQTTTRTVRKRVQGRLVRRRVRITTYRTVSAAPAPCYSGGYELDRSNDTFWNGYFYTAAAIQTLVHESIHLQGDAVEAEAECYGMQWLAYAARQLGDTPDDATAIAQYYATRVYPSREQQTPAYWSAECRANGALDLTPNDGAWPS
jgi:hypothetical protein